MKNDIKYFVSKCPNCKQVKVEHQKLGVMTQEVDTPTWKWEVINMDFFTGLPCTERQHNSTWVIVDRMTNSYRFLAANTTDFVEDYSKLYINDIVKFHGVPLSIISDRCPQITSHFWKSFQVLTHTCSTSSRDVGSSSQYPNHAQIDSQSRVQQIQW